MELKIVAACLCAVSFSFAQWGGNFGGQQQGGGKIEYSEKFPDVNYVGDGKTYHALDIYLPKETKDSYPVVVHTYGSAWAMNDSKGSADLNTICAGFLKAGYAVVTPNHRSADDAKYPAQLHDLKAVVRFLRGNAAKYKLDTSFIAMSGFSSGGHLSSLVATTCCLKEGKSGSVTVDLVGDLGEYTSLSSCIDGAVLWSPPTDIYTMNPINNFMGSGTYEGKFIGVEREGNKDKWMVASSPYYASEDDPPIILFHGTADQIVNPEQSKELYDSLMKYNVVTELVSVSGGTHGGNEMYVSENLDKAVSFLNTAREAKAASVEVTPPDTSTQDSTVQDSTVQDSSAVGDSVITALPVLRSMASGPVSYKVFTLDGTLVMKSSSLDLSRLNPGVYYVVSTSRSGRQVFRFAKR